MVGLPLQCAGRFEALLDPPSAADEESWHDFVRFAAQHLGTDEERVYFPDAELRAFASAGFAASFAPGTCDWARATRLAFWLSAHDPDVALCLGGTVLGTLPVLVAGNERQKARLAAALGAGEMAAFAISEWDHGLDLLNNIARAAPLDADGQPCALADATHFRLSGVKAPINNATRAELVAVLLRTSDGVEASSQSLFLLDRAEVARGLGERFSTLGHRCMDLSSVVLDDMTIPASALLGAIGEGFFHTRRTLEISRAGVGAMATGLSTRAFALAFEHAETRHLYGAKVSSIPHVRELLAHGFARVLEAIATSRWTARLLAHAASSARHLSCAAKLVLPQLLEENVHACGTVLGARSLLESLPFARLRRTAPVYAVFDGSTLLQKEELWRCLITWRDPGSLAPAQLDAHWARLAVAPPSFDPTHDEPDLVESLTPAALLHASAQRLTIPRLSALAAAAHQLAGAASRIRRGTASERRAASDCAGVLYAVSAFAALVAVADDTRRIGLEPALRLRSACAARRIREGFDELQLTPPTELGLELARDLATDEVAGSVYDALEGCWP